MTPVPIEKLRFYSQNGEDQLLWDFFEGKQGGCYIDVGAFDGVYLSNTYSFYSQGWRGVCIEPNRRYFEALEENRPEDVCVNAACLDRDEEDTTFFADLLGLYSTTAKEPEAHEGIERRYKKNSIPFSGLEEYEVPTITVARAASMLNPDSPNVLPEIDFVSIDVEGMELAVLKGVPEKLRPRVFVIEENDAENREKNSSFLVGELGYVLARSIGVNTFYARHADDAIRLRGISIRCAIEKVLHPLGPDFTLPEYRFGRIIDEVAERRIQELERLTDEISDAKARTERAEGQLRSRLEEMTNALDLARSQVASAESERGALASRLESQILATQVQLDATTFACQRSESLGFELSRVRDRLNVVESALRKTRIELERSQAELKVQNTTIENMSSAYRLGFMIMHPIRFLTSQFSRN